MAVRQKQTILETLHKHFKEFELPLDIDYKSYALIVGAKDALNAVSIKRGFKQWKYATSALKIAYPELGKKPVPAPKPVVEEVPVSTGLEALKASSNKKVDHGKDI